jgi:hypothetical protein
VRSRTSGGSAAGDDQVTPEQLGERRRVDRVGLHLRVTDRLDELRVPEPEVGSRADEQVTGQYRVDVDSTTARCGPGRAANYTPSSSRVVGSVASRTGRPSGGTVER